MVPALIIISSSISIIIRVSPKNSNIIIIIYSVIWIQARGIEPIKIISILKPKTLISVLNAPLIYESAKMKVYPLQT